MKDDVIIKVKHFSITILYAILVWFLDSTIDYLFFSEGKSFSDIAFFQISSIELYHRLIFIAFILLYGVIQGIGLLHQRQKNIAFRKVNNELLVNKSKLIKANENLSMNNDKFISYLENSPYGIMVLYPSKTIYEGNSEMGNIFGCSRHELEKLTFWDLIPDFAKKMGIDLFDKVDREGSGSADLPYLNHIKEIRFCKIKAIKLDDGNTLVFFTDITKSLEADKKLKESDNRFHSIFNDVDNIAVQGYDKDRSVIYWNRASEVLYGYSKEEAIGQKLEDLIIPENMKENVIAGIINWYENNEPIPSGELYLKCKNGKPVHVYSNHVMINKLNGKKEMFCVDIELDHLCNKKEQLVNVNKN
ncbi:PAS domain-containing protein [Plebeiibacterium sediminum]|uniref:PAS domain-containing protein n=1 Tax=Plebeiibacterium sediminum TaxID=2992112 RepID=A0AAE3M3I1_9BACT|nr:PAS domain-containing protein [Plebeiobacterium sediminum]MCW3786566.1 PAS domain-containing protein [Plebeiobacterium sediminum]